MSKKFSIVYFPYGICNFADNVDVNQSVKITFLLSVNTYIEDNAQKNTKKIFMKYMEIESGK